MSQKPVRTSRIEARIGPDALKVVKRAAEFFGDFVSLRRKRSRREPLRTLKSFAFQSRISAHWRKPSLIRRRRPRFC